MSDELGELLSVMDSLRNPILNKPNSEPDIPPSSRPIPSDIRSLTESLYNPLLQVQLEALLQELEARRNGYEFFPYEEERREIVQIASRLVDYVDAHSIGSIVLLDRSARPVYIGFNEAWKRKHGESPKNSEKGSKPNIYFVNPTGLNNIYSASEWDLKDKAYYKANEASGHLRDPREVQEDFENGYERLLKDGESGILLFDTCIHSGDSVRPVVSALEKAGIRNVQLGVAGDVRNFSEFQPDFVAVEGKPLGVCYPFDKDTITERSLDSASSQKSYDPEKRERSIRLRRELSRIFNEAPDEWFDSQD